MTGNTQRIITAAVLLLLFARCTDKSEHTQEMEAISSPGAAAYIAQTHAALDEFDGGIAEFKDQLAASSDSVRAAGQDELVSLRTQRDKLRLDLERLEGATPDVVERQRSVLDDRLAQMQKELEIARLNAIQERDEFETALGERMAETDSLLTALQHDRQQIDSAIGAELEMRLSDLEDEQAAVVDSIEALREASEETFAAMRSAVARTVVGLQHRVRDVVPTTDGTQSSADVAPE